MEIMISLRRGKRCSFYVFFLVYWVRSGAGVLSIIDVIFRKSPFTLFKKKEEMRTIKIFAFLFSYFLEK